MPGRDVEADSDLPRPGDRGVGQVRQARVRPEVRKRRRSGGRGHRGGSGSGGFARRRDVPQSGRREHRRSLSRRSNPAGLRTKLPDAVAEHLFLDERPATREKLRRGFGIPVLTEELPGSFHALDLARTGDTGLEMRGQLPFRLGGDLPGQTVDRALGEFAAFHETAPSENRAFNVSTARKIRVLTAPTVIPRISAISAYGSPWYRARTSASRCSSESSARARRTASRCSRSSSIRSTPSPRAAGSGRASIGTTGARRSRRRRSRHALAAIAKSQEETSALPSYWCAREINLTKTSCVT